MTAIQEAKDLNTISLESLISNLQIHKMELNVYEYAKKSKYIALKYVAKSAKAPQVRESEEGSEEDSDDEEMSFIIKRF